jgi:hypothetical protein
MMSTVVEYNAEHASENPRRGDHPLDDPGHRAVARCVLGVPPLVGMDDAQLIEWLRPVLAHYLTDPAP